MRFVLRSAEPVSLGRIRPALTALRGLPRAAESQWLAMRARLGVDARVLPAPHGRAGRFTYRSGVRRTGAGPRLLLTSFRSSTDRSPNRETCTPYHSPGGCQGGLFQPLNFVTGAPSRRST